MATATVDGEARFFLIRGGETVLEAKPSGEWIRWDRWDGPVGTSIWTADSSGLEEISSDRAQALIAQNR